MLIINSSSHMPHLFPLSIWNQRRRLNNNLHQQLNNNLTMQYACGTNQGIKPPTYGA